VKANTGVAYRPILFGADLNSNSSFLGNFLGVSLWGISHERWQDAVCTAHGIYAVDQLWSYRRSLWWQRRRSTYDLRGAVSSDGLRDIEATLGANATKL
jgi:hypothetical protein